MTEWRTALRDIELHLADWQNYLDNPESEPMPPDGFPELPANPVDRATHAQIRELAARIETLRSALSGRHAEVADALGHVRKVRSAAAAYRS